VEHDGGHTEGSRRRPRPLDVRWRLQPGDGDHQARHRAGARLALRRGHDPWKDNDFRFELDTLGDGRTRLRFWQDYAVELTDDAFGVYNFNWGYYLESLRLLCATGGGKPFEPTA
jgi:hypothetical protein